MSVLGLTALVLLAHQVQKIGREPVESASLAEQQAAEIDPLAS